MSLLKIENLHVKVAGKEILNGIDLEVNPGEIHAIMGPNGSGKSTLASTLAGKEDFEVTEGSIMLEGKDLLQMPADVRAKEGLFLGFQYPVEIPGVSMANFIKAAVNEVRKYRNLDPLDAMEFLELIKEKASLVEIDKSFLSRSVNEGFSGGEKKRNEVFQMAMLDPKLAILDETDSGLDIDALRIVANGVNKLHDDKRGVVLITHYQRLLHYIVPDVIHVLYKGKIVRTGGKDLAFELEEKGYDWIKNSFNGNL